MDYSKINKKWWNDVVAIHAKSKEYNLAAFKKGKSSLFSIEERELKNVKGKTMLHVMCHFGMDSLSWARKGAVVTGVDISEESIKLAKQLSNDLKIPATFICSDVYKLPKVLDKKFDILFMSYGVLLWLQNLPKFMQIMSLFLKKGGTLYIAELHPFTNILNPEAKIHNEYFFRGPYLEDTEGTYTDWNAKLKGETYMWSYTMGDIINSIIDAGLKIEFLHEFPFSMYEQYPGLMKKNKNGQWVFKNKKIELPLLFSLKATK